MVVADHNAMGNVSAAQRAAEGSGLAVLAGIEVCSAEEVHSVAIMPDVQSAGDLEALIWERLPGENVPDVFGMQVLADHEDNVEGFCDKMLIGACELSLDAVARAVHQRDGLLIAAHVDRMAFGVIAQLGFIPPDTYDAVEVSANADPAEYRDEAERLGVPIVRGSDAHQPKDMGRAATRIKMARPVFSELVKAIRGRDGRKVIF